MSTQAKICGEYVDWIKKNTSYYDCSINASYVPDWCPDAENIRADNPFPNTLENVFFENCVFQGDTSFCCSDSKCEFVNCNFSGKLLLFLWNDRRVRFKGCEAAVTELTILRNKMSKYINPTINQMYEASCSSGCSVLNSLACDLFTSLVKIKFLNLKYSNFPFAVFSFSNLKEIDLSRCEINADFLDMEGGSYLSLKKLNLSHNNFESMHGISELPSLTELDFSNNPIRGVPEEMKRLVDLEKLNLSGNIFSSDEKAQLKEFLPKCIIEF